jgi:hypothetical protein
MMLLFFPPWESRLGIPHSLSSFTSDSSTRSRVCFVTTTCKLICCGGRQRTHPAPMRIRQGDRRLQATGELALRLDDQSERAFATGILPGILGSSLEPRASPRQAASGTRTEPGVVSVERCISPTSLAKVRRETSRGGYPTREGRLAWIGPVGGNGDSMPSSKKPPRSRGGVITIGFGLVKMGNFL